MLLVQRNTIALYHAALGELAQRGLLAGISRVDSFGDTIDGVARFALYGRGLTEAQRNFNDGELNHAAGVVFIDLESADDVVYILAAREDLLVVLGIEPVTVYARKCENPTRGCGRTDRRDNHMASAAHVPENATFRARVTVGGMERLLFYVPSIKSDERPYLFACGPNGEHPSCECEYRHPYRHGLTCQLVERAAEVAARADHKSEG